MGTNITGIGNANAIGFKSRVTGGIYFPPELKDALVGVWSAYGKSNDSTDRNIIKNKIKDRGGDFVISNAAFKLNSGFGGFVEDFTSWDRIDSSTAEISNDGSKIKCINTTLNVQYLFNYINRDISSFKVKISNFTKGDITYYYRKEDGIEAFFKITPLSVVNSDKVIELPKSYNTVEGGTGSRGGFYSSNINIGVTIEQIPSFEGAFVTDGVNDLITSTKTVQEMLGGSNEITVISMIHGIGSKNAYTNVLRESGSNYIRNTSTADGKTGIYGYTCKDTTKSIITDILGDKNDYKLEYIQTTTPSTIDSVFSVAGWRENNGSMIVYPVAWYWTIIANKVLTTDEINQVIAYYNLDRTLRPDIFCNITKQGITNDNHADFNDKLIDYSGNGRDIQMYNLAWKGGSGIAAKKFETIKDYNIIPDEGLQELTIYNEFSFKIKSIRYADRYWAVQSLNKTDMSYPVTIITDKDIIWRNTLNYTDADGVKGNVKKETNVPANTPTQVFIYGFNDFDISDDYTKVNCVAYATRKDITEFTVTFIPSCKGGLLLDGVNDFGKVTGMPVYKDYTVVADYERLKINIGVDSDSPILSKSESVNLGAFLFNTISSSGDKVSYSFGRRNIINADDTIRKIFYQSKYINDGQDINIESTFVDSDKLWLGTYRDSDYRFIEAAIYSLMSFPYSMSEFLIERQLKKHKLGTLYPDMVEFRPVIKTNTEWEYLEIYQGDNRLYNLSEHDDKTGIYLEENSSIEIYVKPYTGQKVSKIVYNGTSYIDLENNGYGYYYITVPVTKSPQKIGITIEWDENYVQWNPVVESNVAYKSTRYYKLGDSDSGWIGINIGDYIPIGRMIMITIDTANTVDELVSAVSSQLTGIGLNGSNGTYNITGTLTSESPQNINITIDEYIRFEDIVQPYPLFFEFTDENGNLISWGGKAKVGNTIIRTKSVSNANILAGLYNSSSYKLNGKPLEGNSYVVEKQMVFTCTTTYLLDNNEPKCILSPSRLRIPNSSYKLLGYIPDISGHGNHGKINNSAYAEESGVNEDGSYQFDGVDDFVTIPTLSSGGKQVLMKVNSRKPYCYLYDQRNNWTQYLGIVSTKDFIAYDYSNRRGKTYIDGILNENITANDLIGITHNITATNNRNDVKQYSPCIGTSFARNSHAQMALYDFMLFDNISTDDKIKELNEYVGIEGNTE